MKLKTRKSALKRIKIKKNYFARKKAFKGHLRNKKTSKRLRRLSNRSKIQISDVKNFKTMVPYA